MSTQPYIEDEVESKANFLEGLLGFIDEGWESPLPAKPLLHIQVLGWFIEVESEAASTPKMPLPIQLR